MKQYFIFFFTILLSFNISLHAQVNTDKVLTIGRNALYFEDYMLSIQYFNQVIKAKPYLAEPYLYRAIAKFNLEDYNGAESDITLCLERNQFLVYAYQCRGAAYQNLQNYNAAIKDYRKGLEFRPEDKQMLINLGIAYLQSKDYDDAEQVFNQLLQYHPKFTPAYLTRGAMYFEKGDTLKALSDFNTTIEMDKYYAQAYGQRGLIYFQMDSLNQALSDFDEAIRLENRQIAYYINRGLVRYNLNDLRGTMTDYDKVIELEPNNLIARYNRGLLRGQLGDNNRAVEDFDVVIKQEPDNYMALYNRAVLREEIGQNKGAIEDINRVLDEYPNFFTAFYFRSSIKRKIGDMVGADRDYWYAYDLEKKLLKEKEKGKVVTGKTVLPVGSETADNEEDNDKTREKSDKSIEKFNRLVVYDKEEELAMQYKNEIRGKVQNRQVKIELEPMFVISYYEQGGGLENLPHFDKKTADYNKVKNLHLLLRMTNKEAALTEDQADAHFQSIDHYSLLIDRNPIDKDAYFCRSLDFMVLQDLSEALLDLDRTIALDSTFIMAYFNRAAVRFKQLEITNASSPLESENNSLALSIQTGKKIKQESSSSPYVKSNPEEDLKKNENKPVFEYELIKQDYDVCLRLDPDFIYAYFNRGNLKCMRKDYRSALQDYNEAIKRSPEFAEAYFNRGLTRLYLGDTDNGIADLSKAGELGLINAYGIIKRMTVE